MREISEKMRINFFLKSDNINKTKNSEIQFKDKFKNEYHSLDINESGNILDFNLFNGYYFNDIFPNESKLFLNIKTITSVKDFNDKLENIITEEKDKGVVTNQVNKFKKLDDELVRRCIRSRILRTIKVSEEEYKKEISYIDND